MAKGKLLIFSAPSGSGKTTIVKYILSKIDNLEFSISATSRSPRKGEIHEKDYYFLTPDEFKSRIEKNEFIEWEEVYKNRFYGTLKSEVERIRNNGKTVIFDVDVIGGLNIKKIYGDEALAVFIQPPSIDTLKDRLINRKTDSIQEIEKRIEKANYELTFANKFDKVVVNDVLETAQNEVLDHINKFLY